MHIRPADRDVASAGASHSGRELERSSIRLGGGAARVPASKETTESPLRAFVSTIGQSIGARTPLRKQSSVTTPAKNEVAYGSSTRRTASNKMGSSQTPVKPSTSAKVTITASTPRKSYLSSSADSSSSIPTSTPMKKQSPSVTSSRTPVAKRSFATNSFGSSARSSNNPTTPDERKTSTIPPRTPTTSFGSSVSSNNPTTPVGRKTSTIPPRTPTTSFGSSARSSNKPTTTTPVGRKTSTIPPRTPTAVNRTQNYPTTPISRCSSIPTPSKKPGVLSTPISMQPTTPSDQRKQVNLTTPIAKQTSVPPTTPVNQYNVRTPLNSHGSNIPFYTPKTALPGKSSLSSPLQPRNTNVPSESSRRLHFGINLSAMAEQENMGQCTPRAYPSGPVDATYSLDKSRLAQIKARRNVFQKLLTSPAQRVRVPDSGGES